MQAGGLSSFGHGFCVPHPPHWPEGLPGPHAHMAAARSEAASKARLLLEGLSLFATMGVSGPTVEEAVKDVMDMSEEPPKDQASTSFLPHAPVEDQSPPPPALLPELFLLSGIFSHDKGVVWLQPTGGRFSVLLGFSLPAQGGGHPPLHVRNSGTLPRSSH
jgi:hypothetical protein